MLYDVNGNDEKGLILWLFQSGELEMILRILTLSNKNNKDLRNLFTNRYRVLLSRHSNCQRIKITKNLHFYYVQK